MKVGIIGVGRFGYHVAATLADNGVEVLAVDSNESVITTLRDRVSHAICLQINDEESLRSIGIESMDVVIVAMGENFAQSILVTALLKQKIAVARVITRAINQIHKEILTLIGANEVILPEQEVGIQLAHRLALPFKNPLVSVTEQFSILQLQAPKKFVGKKVKEVKLYDAYHVTCIGHKFNDEVIIIGDEYIISDGDILFFAGANEHLEKISKL